LRLPGVAAARVRVAKPQVFADCDMVSVEVRVQHSEGAT
jgi:dihydroneopterin aldolase